ncbi:hypothetical protein ACIP17_13625 [Streptomyces iakyrus]|uniref:hypothetical protein n=1 Tax=Streptomyces iakyrus TaxID=68219 RepID=UPI003800844E
MEQNFPTETVKAAGEPPKKGMANGYSLILPPNWKRIPLRRKSEREAAVKNIIESACKQLPKNFPRDLVTRYRLEVERRLSIGIKGARKSGGLDFYLPMADPGESPIAASFVVGEISAEGDPGRFLGAMTSTGGYDPVDIDEAPGARREVVAEPDAQEGIELASRRVDYMAAVPGDPGRWLTVSFSTMGGGDPNDDLSDATVSLFDAIMTTFRWSSE